MKKNIKKPSFKIEFQSHYKRSRNSYTYDMITNKKLLEGENMMCTTLCRYKTFQYQ